MSTSLFASYAHRDYAEVEPVLEAIRRAGIEVWSEVQALQPGQQWSDQIAGALSRATGLLLFLTPASIASDFVRREVSFFASRKGLLIPVLLEPFERLPGPLELTIAPLQQIDLTGPRTDARIKDAARLIAEAARRAAPPQAGADPAGSRQLAESIAADARKSLAAQLPTGPPRSVFLVHGHDDSFLSEVEAFVRELGLEPLVLCRIGGPSQSLFQKFMQWGTKTKFAIVLLTADDLGAARRQFEADGVGQRSLQFRARQNVILELGFFYGHLGWENVFVLYKEPDAVFPNFERPSDLDGVVFDHVDLSGNWRACLSGKLAEAGFPLAETGA